MGLSTGEIVGIVIGVILAVIFLFFIYLWIKRMITSRRVVPVALSTEAEAAREAAREAETIYKEALRERDDYVLPDGTRIDFAAIGRKERLEEEREAAEKFQEEQRIRDNAELTRLINQDLLRQSSSREATTGTGFDQSSLNQLGLLNALDERGQGDLPAIPEEVEPEDLTGFQTSSKRRGFLKKISPTRLIRRTRNKTNTTEQGDPESPRIKSRFSPKRVFRRN